MIHFKLSQTINRPLDEVFAYWSDPDNVPAWQGGVVSYRRTSSGPLGIGTTYSITRKALGMRQETSGEYTAYEHNRRVCERIEAGPAKYTIQTEFTAQGTATRVDIETQIDLSADLFHADIPASPADYSVHNSAHCSVSSLPLLS